MTQRSAWNRTCAVLGAVALLAASPPVAVSQSSNDNSASITQIGEANVAFQIQHGSGNEMSVLQIGAANAATQKQLGDDNRMRIEQTGPYNEAFIVQEGSGLDIEVIQDHGPPIEIIQR